MQQGYVVAKITYDGLAEDLGTHSFLGEEWFARTEEDTHGERVPFRLLDDDRNIYYEGWLLNDDEGNNQLELLDWGMHDSGCTSIEVLIDRQWKQEVA